MDKNVVIGVEATAVVLCFSLEEGVMNEILEKETFPNNNLRQLIEMRAPHVLDVEYGWNGDHVFVKIDLSEGANLNEISDTIKSVINYYADSEEITYYL